jgi:hypothetical protein
LTYDVVALLPRIPDLPQFVEGLAAAGEELRVASTANGYVIQLFDESGLPVVSVETPVLVQVDGEIARLLGAEVAAGVPTPVWWVEARAPSVREGAAEKARAIATALAERLGGVVWP